MKIRTLFFEIIVITVQYFLLRKEGIIEIE